MPQQSQTLRQKLISYFQGLVFSFKTIGTFTWNLSIALKKEMNKKIKKWQPHFLWMGSALRAIVSFVSTLKTSLNITPVVFSMLTVLSTIPLFQLILPNFIFEPMIFTPILVGIAAIAGYRTYIDAIERNRLDKKIEDDGKEIIALKNKLYTLEQKLAASLDVQLPISNVRSISRRVSHSKRRAKGSETLAPSPRYALKAR